MAKRTRYQYGSVEIDKRVTGPDVWIYRWRETTSDGRKKRRGFTVGTVEKYRTEAHALKAAEGMRLLINDGVAAREPVLFCGFWTVSLSSRSRNRKPNKSPTVLLPPTGA